MSLRSTPSVSDVPAALGSRVLKTLARRMSLPKVHRYRRPEISYALRDRRLLSLGSTGRSAGYLLA